MRRPRRMLAWLLLVLVGLGAETAAAVNPCPDAAEALRALGGDGMGGTGLVGDDEDGIGGTGHVGDDEDGVGGTGLVGDDEDGMGGTGLHASRTVGIVGTITGFGSVCVNGERVAVDAGTPVEMDGAQVTARVLAVGHVVSVEARNTNNGLQAERISIQRAVVGPVTRVDVARGRLYVMGKAVHVPIASIGDDGRAGGTVDLASVSVGQRVAVSGLHRSDGVLVASRLETAAPGVDASVSGQVQSLGSGSFAIGEVRVTSPAGAVAPTGYTRAVGHWNGERGTLETERVEQPRAFSERVARVSVEGFVRDRRNADFRLSGMDVNGAAVVDQLPATGEARVVVVGSLGEGQVRAERIWLRDRMASEDSLPEEDDPDDRSDSEDREDREDRENREDREDREDRSGRSDRVERSERPERPERAERPDRSGRD